MSSPFRKKTAVNGSFYRITAVFLFKLYSVYNEYRENIKHVAGITVYSGLRRSRIPSREIYC